MDSTTQAGQTSGVSKVVDENFDTAFNNSLIANDLTNVRWGRIDYLNVTYLTTKWSVWQCVDFDHLVILILTFFLDQSTLSRRYSGSWTNTVFLPG